MTIWLFEPRDPVIFRDGRPFNAAPGARAKSLAFPLPATTAGATRTRAGQDSNGRFIGNSKELLSQWVRGPFLVELDEAGNQICNWLFPAPADALLLKHDPYDERRAGIVPLTPFHTPRGVETNLPDNLALVAPVQEVKQKPHPKAPAFWRWQTFQAWLTSPQGRDDVHLSDLGIAGPTRESRMHVSIDAKTQTAQDGALFQTSGLEFINVPARENVGPIPLSTARTLGLAIETDAAVKEGLSFLGGERRVARWQTGPGQLPLCPPAVREAVCASKHCRLILATPALFDQGLLPDTNRLLRFGVSVTVEAVTNSRYQTVSGWDYAENEPKATRRLAPAGSVYYLALDGDKEAIGQFIDQVWLQAISDDEQACRDGFGLALIGAWDGALEMLHSSREMTR